MSRTLEALYERFDQERVERALAELGERGAITVGHPVDRWYSPERELATMGWAALSVGGVGLVAVMAVASLRSQPGQEPSLPGAVLVAVFAMAALAAVLAAGAAHFEFRRRGRHGLAYDLLSGPVYVGAEPTYIGAERAVVGMWLALGYPWSPFARLVRIDGIERGEGLNYEFSLSDGTRTALGPEDSLPAAFLREAFHLNPKYPGRSAAPGDGAMPKPLSKADEAGDRPPWEPDSPDALLRRAYNGADVVLGGKGLEAIAAAGKLARDLDGRLVQLVLSARVHHAAWAEIGAALGLSAEEAIRRFTPGLDRYQGPAVRADDPEDRSGERGTRGPSPT